jgi:hypothetical protein
MQAIRLTPKFDITNWLVCMYLDTGTMIGIIIALVVGMLTIGYSIYIIKTQNEIIQRMSDVSATRRKMER